MTQTHISQVPDYPVPNGEPVFWPDGLCHCDPQPESSPIGECPKCRRLDVRKATA